MQQKKINLWGYKMKTRLNLVIKFEKRIAYLEDAIRQANEYNDGTLENIEFIYSCMNDIMLLEDRMLTLNYTI